MAGPHKIRHFSQEEIDAAVSVARNMRAGFWDAFVRYQRLEPGYDDQEGYGALCDEMAYGDKARNSGLLSLRIRNTVTGSVNVETVGEVQGFCWQRISNYIHGLVEARGVSIRSTTETPHPSERFLPH